MNKIMKFILQFIAFCCFFAGGVRAQRPGYWCNGDHIPLDSPKLPVHLTNFMFTSVEEVSFAHVEIGNDANKPVNYYLILVGLFDKNGKHLLTVPFYNTRPKTGESPFPIAFNRWLYGHTPSVVTPLRPSSTDQLEGNSPTVTFACPTSGRIMMAQLRYADDTTFRFASPELNLEPLIAWAPLSDSALSSWAPAFVTLTLSVDVDGRAQLTSWNSAPQSLSDIIKKQVEHWLLSKPLNASQPSPADLTVVLCLEDVGSQGQLPVLPLQFYTEMPLLEDRGLPTVVVLHAYRLGPAAMRWRVTAGRRFVDKLDERQR